MAYSFLRELELATNARHKVFVSYHHANDEGYRNRFEKLFTDIHDIYVSQSVQIGDIDESVSTETIRQKIRDEYLRNTTVTVVLIGSETWKRKHVDWEIGSSLRNTQFNPRSGLVGILLPSYPRENGDMTKYNSNTIPPRLANNLTEPNPFASIHNWTEDPNLVQNFIHAAFTKRSTVTPNNSYPSFSNNRSTFATGWQ
jgi:hypothetical protein